MKAKHFSLVQIHLVVLLAGGSGLFGKWLHLAPATITCVRATLGAATVAIAAWLLNWNLRAGSGKQGALLAFSGALLAIHWLAFFSAIQVSTVAIGLLGFASFPLFVTFLEPIFFRERLHRRDVVTAFMIVGGLVLITPKFDVANHLTQGMLFGILSGLAYAFISLLNRAQVRTISPLAVVFYQQIFAALFAAPFIWLGSGDFASIGHKELWLLLLLGVVFTGLAQSLLVASLRNLSAQTISILLGLEPIYGILLAWFLLEETPASRTLWGGAIILLAVLWVSYRQSATPPPVVGA